MPNPGLLLMAPLFGNSRKSRQEGIARASCPTFPSDSSARGDRSRLLPATSISRPNTIAAPFLLCRQEVFISDPNLITFFGPTRNFYIESFSGKVGIPISRSPQMQSTGSNTRIPKTRPILTQSFGWRGFADVFGRQEGLFTSRDPFAIIISCPFIVLSRNLC